MQGGIAFIVAGGTGTGKTTVVKNALQKIHPEARLVFDNNKEYTGIYDKPFDPDFKRFALAASKVRNAAIVFEEATIFLKRQGVGEHTIKVLVEKRHRNNIIFLVFHSLRLVPLDIMDLCNYMVILKTNDSVESVERRFNNEIISNAFNEIKNSPMLFNPSANKHYSPHKIISLQAYT
jgi:DNA helicase HerA-like ATPase